MVNTEFKLLRVMDANFNRAKEGLRVCEDVCRFLLNDAAMTKILKNIRHQLTIVMVPLGLKAMMAGRDVAGDVGKKSNLSESRREKPMDIFYANCQRVKESMRVLEEFAKLKSIKTSAEIKKMRYEMYKIEKQVLNSQEFDGS